jgi:hypothetical protein
MRWVRHVEYMVERNKCIQNFAKKPEGKRPLGRLRHRWEDNFKTDLKEITCGVNSSGSGQ